MKEQSLVLLKYNRSDSNDVVKVQKEMNIDINFGKIRLNNK